MYSDFINNEVTVVISSRGDNLLEYRGLLKEEDNETLLLENVDICYLMLNFQKGIFGDNMARYKSCVEIVRINKKYIISCSR